MRPEGPLGVLCGAGWLPHELLRRLQMHGALFHVIAFEEQTPPEMTEGLPHDWVRIGAAATAIECLRSNKCADLVMVGRLKRPPLQKLRPDLWTARFLSSSGAFALGDNGMLSALLDVLETKEGFRIWDAGALMPDLLAPEQTVTAAQPAPGDETSVAAAARGARETGAADAGQACVARADEILAREDAEGTEAMLARLAGGKGAGGVLAKFVKPGQDVRVDRPAIGPDTVPQAVAAGLRGIVVEAGGVLLLDPPALTAAADAAGLFITGRPAPAAP
ncbi:MAG: LpxI family protein [Rhodospirillales bacterium]